ncbi:MAG TPA: STAS domain-containing protein [Actinomycetota bacterium]
MKAPRHRSIRPGSSAGRLGRSPPSIAAAIRCGARRSPDPRRLSIEPLGRRALALIGEIDTSVRSKVASAIADVVSSPGGAVLDLAGLRFMDSAGIHVLTEAARELKGDDAITVRNPRPCVLRVLVAAATLGWEGRLRIELDRTDP